MRLKSFGCSFIFGSDLSDDGSGQYFARYSHLTWPSLLAAQQNLEYQCYARPGSGNLRILETLLSHTAKNQKDLFVIGWTWIDRFDYNSDATLDRECPVQWTTMLPTDTTSEAHFYYKNLHSQFKDKLSTLMCIKLAIDTLKQKECPFIMTYMDNLIFETEWHTTPAIVDLQNYIRPYLSTFNGNNFLDWSRINGFDISPAMHPLEPAHKAAAELVSTNLNSYIKQ